MSIISSVVSTGYIDPETNIDRCKINVLPNDLLDYLFEFLPDEDFLNVAQVNRSFSYPLDPKYSEGLVSKVKAVRQSEYARCLSMPDHILTHFRGKICTIKREYFLKSASRLEIFKHYVGYNNLAVIMSLYKQQTKNPQASITQESSKIRTQDSRLTEEVKCLSWYKRIPIEILRNFYVKDRVSEYNQVGDDYKCKPTLSALFAATVYPDGPCLSGIKVVDPSLLAFKSLSGRAVCLLNAIIYGSLATSLIPLVLIAMTIGLVGFFLSIPVVLTTFLLVVLFEMFTKLDKNSFLIKIIFLPLFFSIFLGYLPLILIASQSGAFFRSMAAAVIDPRILLTRTLRCNSDASLNISLPNYLLDV